MPMDPSCLQYCMTDAQRDHFEQQGYLIVEDALDGDMLGWTSKAGGSQPMRMCLSRAG